MTFRLGPVTVLGLGLLGAMMTTGAGAADAAKGKVLAYTCHGCHGVPDYKNAFPNYRVPKLGGQNEAYIVSALNAYANGERPHPTMHAQAVTLTPEERADIAAFFAAEGGLQNKEVVGTPPPATQTCVACHGADGAKTVAPDYPKLAGQPADYLVHALKDYKSGKRKNPIMAGIISGVDEKDFEAIAEFFSRQQALCTTDQIQKHGKCAAE
ncbi:c-type cytochrome [Steroidobacter sp. S1-65]|uniref:C-type cytochrome n=1 Tax=Steroidobacter gossypii TaxID=2805490 RepID=A0ABS1WT82_9GAMM|nr:c-type cytochrome [Steroidobacter gossypii]MBM0104175.1 c-type cytochrome [Steroidobacter gossypii]